MKKIIIAVILWMALCGTAFTQSASDFTVDANGVITKYTGFDTVVVIPATIGGKNITAIGKEAFLRADLTSVTIPDGVTSIGVSAFNGNKLTGITIPNSVTEIGERAFYNNRLTSVTIPGSVKEINRDAFRGNTALATIIISEGVEKIRSGAFADTKCTSVSLPSTITYLSDKYTGYPFDTSGKPSFTLAANINAEFDYIPAFYSYIVNDRKAGTYASNLPLVSKKADDYEYYETRYGAVLMRYTGNSNRVRIPATIGGVTVKALYGTPNSFTGTFERIKLAAAQIPEGITYIGSSTFAGNELANVTIPNSVAYIGSFAFSGNQLTSVTIPDSVIFIGSTAFGENKLTNVTIGTGVIYIDTGAFSRNQLTSITIPKNVTSIGANAFYENRLTSITIGSNVELLSYIGGGIRYTAFGNSSFDTIYNNNKKAAGTYTYVNGNWTKQQTVPFPSGFVGTWKRDNFNNTITITTNTFKSSSQNSTRNLMNVSGDSYTMNNYAGNGTITITIKQVNSNIVISGDSGDGEDNWNGTWKKIN